MGVPRVLCARTRLFKLLLLRFYFPVCWGRKEGGCRLEGCFGEARGCSGMRFEPGIGKLWCANGEKEGCCATLPAPGGGSHISRILLCPQCWGSIPGLPSLAICEAQIAACSSPAALGLEVLDLQQSSVMGASTHGPGGLRSGRGSAGVGLDGSWWGGMRRTKNLFGAGSVAAKFFHPQRFAQLALSQRLWSSFGTIIIIKTPLGGGGERCLV